MLLPRLCPLQPYLMGAVVVNSVTTGARDLLVTHTHSRVVAARTTSKYVSTRAWTADSRASRSTIRFLVAAILALLDEAQL